MEVLAASSADQRRGGGLFTDWEVCRSCILTSDIGQSEAFSCQTVIRVEMDPNVVLWRDVGWRQGGTTNPQPIQAPVAADRHPVWGTTVGTLEVEVLETMREEEMISVKVTFCLNSVTSLLAGSESYSLRRSELNLSTAWLNVFKWHSPVYWSCMNSQFVLVL